MSIPGVIGSVGWECEDSMAEVVQAAPSSLRSSSRIRTGRSMDVRPRGAVRRIIPWSFSVLVAAVLVALEQPLSMAFLILALASMAAVAVVPQAGRRATPLLGALPAGFTLVVAWGLLWGLAGGGTGVGAWSTRAASLAGVAAFIAVTGLVVWRRGGSIVLVGGEGAAAVGFLALSGFFVVLVARLPLEVWSRMNSTGSDFLRHLGLILDVRGSGGLLPGEVTYPRALHALGAWMTSSSGIGTGIDDLWRAVAPVQFLMLALMLLAVMVISRRTGALVCGSSLLGNVSAVVAGLAFLQTAWFDAFITMGNLLNLIVGVALLGMLAFGPEPVRLGTASGWLVAAASVAVIANAWQLLIPVAAFGSLPWLLDFLRQGSRRPSGWAIWTISAALAVHGLGLRVSSGVGSDGIRTATSSAAVSFLDRPEWWWGVAIGLSVLATVGVMRSGWGSWAVSYAGMLVGGIVMMVVVMRVSGSTWDRMLYYPSKALWTGLVIVIPLAAVGGVLLAHGAWRRATRDGGVSGLASRSVIVCTGVVILAAVLGRGAAFAPHLEVIARGGPAAPAWSLAAISTLARSEVVGNGFDGRAIVFGVVPGADVALAQSSYPGTVDYLAMEAVGIAGIARAFDDPIKEAIAERDVDGICRFLRDNPDALRITGPNTGAGPWWLVGAGCSIGVVRPDQWVSLDIDRTWLASSPWDSAQWRFPSFDAVRSAGLSG